MSNLLFDLDGTLADSGSGIIAAFRYTFDELNLDTPDLETLTTFIGPPLEETFTRIFQDEDSVNKAIEIFRSYYNTKGVYQAKLYKDVKDTLEQLSKKHQLFVTTSKNEPMAHLMLKEFNIDSYFTGVYGAVPNRYSKADVIKSCLVENNLSNLDSYIIGDTKFDMIGGQETGIKTIAVNWGFGTIEDLQDCQPDHLIDDPKELLEIFTT